MAEEEEWQEEALASKIFTISSFCAVTQQTRARTHLSWWR